MGHRGSTNLPLQICFNSTHTRLSFQSLKRKLKQPQRRLQWKRHYKINLRSVRFHFSDYVALISQGWIIRNCIHIQLEKGKGASCECPSLSRFIPRAARAWPLTISTIWSACSQTNEWTLTEKNPPYGKLIKSEAGVWLTGFLRELFVI